MNTFATFQKLMNNVLKKYLNNFITIRVAGRCGDTDGVSVRYHRRCELLGGNTAPTVRCGVHFFDTDGVHDTVGVFT